MVNVDCSWHSSLPIDGDIPHNWSAYVQELGGGVICDVQQAKMKYFNAFL